MYMLRATAIHNCDSASVKSLSMVRHGARTISQDRQNGGPVIPEVIVHTGSWNRKRDWVVVTDIKGTGNSYTGVEE